MFRFKDRTNEEDKKENKVRLEGCLVETEDKLCRHRQYKDSCYFCLTGKEPNEPEPETRDPFNSSAFKNI